jgi:hypothetical protein
MRRRELLRLIASLTGAAFVSGGAPRAAASRDRQPVYSDADIRLLDEVTETILPRTDTPGAKDAGVGAFIARYSAARYEPAHIAILKEGIKKLDSQMRALHEVAFVDASDAQRKSLLVTIDSEAKRYVRTTSDAKPAPPPHYFTLLKQLTLYGFFTSEAGATRVARYRPIPGKYKGCIPYKSGETFWAW